MTDDDLDRPADTAMMRLVHQALRRDLDRARAAIDGPVPRPTPSGAPSPRTSAG